MLNILKKIVGSLLVLFIFSFSSNSFAEDCGMLCKGTNRVTECRMSSSDKNTCENSFESLYIGTHRSEPAQCVWNYLVAESTAAFVACKINQGYGKTFTCTCMKSYANPSNGVPNSKGRCPNGDKFEALCYEPCKDNYKMNTAGICYLKGF
jgi:hypothetical protein